MTVEATPRIVHNLGLWKAFSATHKTPPVVPPVHEQLEAIQINSRALFQFGYNPSIIRYSGRIFMAYRYHHQNTWQTALAMAELNEKFEVIDNRKITLPGSSNEDPRLFIHENEVHISYVEARGDAATITMPSCSIRYGRMMEGKSWTVDGQFLVKYGNNEGASMEKNWCPLSNWVKYPWFIYATHPEQVAIWVIGHAVHEERKSTGAQWKWGQIRGGTTPLPYKDGLIRFFHSRLDNEPAPYWHRYYIGAIIMKREPPFEIVQVSKRPIVRGSELDSGTATERSSCRHWKANCVLPFGAIEAEGSWFVSVGINDFQCALLKVTEKDLNL